MALNVYLESLGCAKNLVDSEMMLGLLKQHHFIISSEPQKADIIIVNTCGFIEDAQAEAINTILEMAQYKENGRCRLLIATGCLVEKYCRELLAEIPELDAVLGTQEYHHIARLIRGQMAVGHEVGDDMAPIPRDIGRLYQDRYLTQPGVSAYLKIADGCDNNCSYCLIPQLRGPLKSRSMESLLKEAENLSQQGIEELVVIAQDTTVYGVDLVGHSLLPELLAKLAALPFKWIRLLYVYPSRITTELLQVMAKHSNICHYLDMPIQHAVDPILQAMNRHDDQDKIRTAVDLCRKYLPDIALRTTLMCGFPGESAQQWQQAVDFAVEQEFDWVGVFSYSPMQDTKAAALPSQVSAAEKQKRYDYAMQTFATASARFKQKWLGKTMLVLIEEESPDGEYWLGRSQYQAPEVDGLVYVKKNQQTALAIGDFVKVKITSTDVYDIVGEVIT